MVARKPAALVLFTCLLAMWYAQPHVHAATLLDPPPVQWKRSFPDIAAGWVLERDDKTLWLLAGGRVASILGLTSEGQLRSTIELDRCVGRSFAATRDGGFVVTGYISGESPTRTELFVLKLDASGRSQWQRSFTLDDWAEGVFVDERAGGGYIAIGTSRLNREPYGSSIIILATDPTGAPIWQKRFTGLRRAEAHGAHRTSEGGYVVVGTTQSDAFGGDDVLYVLRITATGGVVWERHFGEIRYHVAGRVVVTRDGGCLIAASANRIDGSAYGGSVLLKLNSAGGTVWRKTLDSVGSEAFHVHWFASVEELTDGGFLLGGMRAVGAVGQQRVGLLGCAIRTNSLGEPVWVWLSDPAPAEPPAVMRLQIAIARATVDGGFAIVVNKGIDEGTGYRGLGCDVVKLRATTANRPPNLPANLAQVLPDGTALPVGGLTASSTVVFRATVSDPDGDQVKLQVELRRLDELGGGFDETRGGLKDGSFVSSGSQSVATASGLIDGAYHWRARAVDGKGATSSWVEFGGNPTSATDFQISTIAQFRSGDKVRCIAASLVIIDHNDAQIGTVSVGYAGIIQGERRVAELSGSHQILWRVEWKWRLDDNGYDVELLRGERLVGWCREEWLLRDDVYWLAKVMTNEADVGVANEKERTGVGWVVLNRIARPARFPRDPSAPMGVVQQLALAGFAPYWTRPHKEPSNVDIIRLAERLLSPNPPSDPTYGGDHFFSPRSMGQTGDDVYPVPKTGGLKARYPFWAKPHGPQGWSLLSEETESYVTAAADGSKAMQWVHLPDIRPWYFMFYRPYVYALTLRLGSAAELRVIDEAGRISGVVAGVALTEIPGSAVTADAVTVPYPSGRYFYEVHGCAEGLYELTASLATVEGTQVVCVQRMPVRLRSIHRYDVQWEVVARGEKGVTLRIDQNGDGVFEREVQAGSEIRGEDIGVIPTGSFVNHGPNPVPAEGCTFWFKLPEGTRSATLLVYSAAGRLVAELSLDPRSSRYPSVGRWGPVDQSGNPLANGPYVYVLIADGKVIGQGKMVIQR